MQNNVVAIAPGTPATTDQENIRELIRRVEFFKDAEAAFEATKSETFKANRARLLIDSWEALRVIEEDLGAVCITANLTTSMRAALALLDPTRS